MSDIILYIFTFIGSYFGVEIFRRWTLRKNILDLPNERSSHSLPTPRGGGLIIVIFTLSLFALKTQDLQLYPYFIGAILIAIISWFDDLMSIPSVYRLFIHTIAACITIYSLGYFDNIFGVQIGYFGIIITFLWIVWLTNAYNFMDGIDGIAGTQTIITCLGWIIYTIYNLNTVNYLAAFILCSTLAFLLHNWSPAKIFMGDVGSSFLGFSFAVIPLIIKQEKNDSNLLILAISFVWLFIFDTVFTFLRRLFKREKVWQAHRSHLYQRLNIAGLTHQNITIIYGIISLFITILTVSIIQYNALFILLIWLLSSVSIYTFTINNERHKRNTI